MAKSKLSKIRDQRAYVELARCEWEDATARERRAHSKTVATAKALATAQEELDSLENAAPGQKAPSAGAEE